MSGFTLDVVLPRRTAGGETFELRVEIETPAGISVVFGPSGAGKSTLLLGVLGALRPRRGRIVAAGRTLFDSDGGIDVPPRDRRVGMVFQDALLFPHLTALGNVRFALRSADATDRARELLDRVGALGLAGREPRELSAGQRQRVALARALAAEPGALLLDEPFAALDAPAREALARLLMELQSEWAIPFLHVTHDLAEAVRLGDHLVLLESGRVVQAGPPEQVVAHPGSTAAAQIVGTENRFAATIRAHDEAQGTSSVDLGGTTVHTAPIDAPVGARVTLGLRAEDVLVSLENLTRTSARNVLAGTISEVRRVGPAVELQIATPAPVRALVTPLSVRELSLTQGTRVYVAIKAAAFQRLA